MRVRTLRHPLRFGGAAFAMIVGVGVHGGCYAGIGDHGAEPTLSGGGLDGGDGADGGDDGDAPQALCGEAQPGPAPIRRLTRTEYNNTIRDLLGDDTKPASAFVGEDIIFGFDNNAEGASMSRLLAEQYETAADEIAVRATADLVGLLGCDPVVDGEQACVRDFLDDFLLHAFRRPAQSSEIDRYYEFFASHRGDEDVPKSMQLTLAAILQSPHFLYRVEAGLPELAADGAVPLSGYEVASRLSYLLWNSLPDDELFAAAAADELVTSEQVADQAERMLADPKARQVVLDFHEQWLALRGSLPSGLATVEPLLREETQTFLTEVVLEGDGRLHTLLRADFSYMNAELAQFYGVDATGLGEDFEKVQLDPTQRSGLLTQAVPMAINAHENETSPIARGRFVRELLLCQELPPPPPNLMVDPPDPDPTKTTRERYAEHREDPACAGCHALIDPLGFAFEHYDQFGQWRDEENGLPIDASGTLTASGDEELDGDFYGAVELADKLAAGDAVAECAVEGWFRYAYGRDMTEADECTVDHLREVFAEGDGNIRELLLALTQTDAFRFRPAQ